MSEEIKKDETKKIEPMKYSVAPSLIINMGREGRIFRFEMPIGSKLAECEEACKECLNVVKKMIEKSEKQEAEEKAKKEANEKSESSDEDSSKKD